MNDLPPGWRHVALGAVDSTQDEAWRLAKNGAPGRTVLTATAQRAGRGRRGRDWESPAGNLHASILLRSIEHSPHELSFVGGLAVADALDTHAEGVALKWPNDVLVEGRKVAGVLLEAEPPVVVLGIGINLARSPNLVSYPATDLRGRVTPQQLLPTLVRALDARLEEWRTLGFAYVREAWLERAWRLGAKVEIDEKESGRFAGIDSDGALLLDPGLRRVVAGSVRYRQ
jgi:BirA family biotin operon repressor/biotin-[acetyl-CoA-carboxylase] ligase